MVRRLAQEEELRSQHKLALLQLQERALQEKTQAQLAWLSAWKRKFRKKGAEDLLNHIRKQQQQVIERMNRERKEISRLKDMHRMAIQNQKSLVGRFSDQNRNDTGLTSAGMKQSSSHHPEVKHSNQPAKVHTKEGEVTQSVLSEEDPQFMQHDKRSPSEVPEELLASEQSPPELISKLESREETGLPALSEEAAPEIPSTTVQSLVNGSQSLDSVLQGLRRLEASKRYLTKREQKLLQRRKDLQQLVLWQKKLDAEELKIREMEQKVLAQLQSKRQLKASNTSSSSVANDSGITALPPPKSSFAASTQIEEVQTEVTTQDNGFNSKDISEIPTSIHSPESVSASVPEELSKATSNSSQDQAEKSSAPETYLESFESSDPATTDTKKHSSTSSEANHSTQERNRSLSSVEKSKLLVIRSPLVPYSHQRHDSSGSEESVTISHSETASDQSDIEGRIHALTEELKWRKYMAEKLKREQRRKYRERLKQQEQSLKKQLEAYDQFILQAKQELDRQIEVVVSSQPEQSLASVKPQIKKPRRVGPRAVGKSQEPITDSHLSPEMSEDHSLTRFHDPESIDEHAIKFPYGSTPPLESAAIEGNVHQVLSDVSDVVEEDQPDTDGENGVTQSLAVISVEISALGSKAQHAINSADHKTEAAIIQQHATEHAQGPSSTESSGPVSPTWNAPSISKSQDQEASDASVSEIIQSNSTQSNSSSGGNSMISPSQSSVFTAVAGDASQSLKAVEMPKELPDEAGDRIILNVLDEVSKEPILAPYLEAVQFKSIDMEHQEKLICSAAGDTISQPRVPSSAEMVDAMTQEMCSFLLTDSLASMCDILSKKKLLTSSFPEKCILSSVGKDAQTDSLATVPSPSYSFAIKLCETLVYDLVCDAITQVRNVFQQKTLGVHNTLPSKTHIPTEENANCQQSPISKKVSSILASLEERKPSRVKSRPQDLMVLSPIVDDMDWKMDRDETAVGTNLDATFVVDESTKIFQTKATDKQNGQAASSPEGELGAEPEWFEEDFGLSNKIQQQLEQQLLLQQYQQYYYGQIPNKPPPPYTPPKGNSAVAAIASSAVVAKPAVAEPLYVIPHTVLEVEQLVAIATTALHHDYNMSKPLRDTTLPLSMTENRDSEDTAVQSRNNFKMFLFDLSREVTLEIFRVGAGEHPPWLRHHPLRTKDLIPSAKEPYTATVQHKVCKLLGLGRKESPTSKSGPPNLGRAAHLGRKKRDFVDTILIHELKREESDWVNYDQDEATVKTQVADGIFNTLVDDTVSIMKALWETNS